MKKKGFFSLFQFKGGISIVFFIALGALLWYLIIPRTSLFFRDDIDTPFSDRFHVEDLVMVKGETFKLRVIGTINKRMKFSSTDIKVAYVNIFGKVFALRPGTTVIKAKYDDVIIKSRVRVINLNKRRLTLNKGETYQLRVLGPRMGVRWKSQNKKIATVSRFGKVKGISKGTTKIIAKCGGKEIVCIVKVK